MLTPSYGPADRLAVQRLYEWLPLCQGDSPPIFLSLQKGKLRSRAGQTLSKITASGRADTESHILYLCDLLVKPERL